MAPAQRFAPAREELLRKIRRLHRHYQPDYRATNVGISFENYLQQEQMRRQEDQRRRQEEQRRRQEEQRRRDQRRRQEEDQRRRQEEDRRRAAAAVFLKYWRIRKLREKENRLKAKKTLLYQEKTLLNQLAKLSPNSSPNASTRTSPNASPINNTELAKLYARSRKQAKAKKQKMRAYRRKMLNIGLTRGWEKRAKEKAERSPPKRKKIRSRKRKLSPKKQPSKRRRVDLGSANRNTNNNITLAEVQKSPRNTNNNNITIAELQRQIMNLPKPNAATARKARRRVIEKRRGKIKKKKRNKPRILFDLITGKEKIYTKEGWFLRAQAKQDALRARICA